jgi:exopolysaccharide biosynthesis polyprenyl glycosylphosphotransferase
MALIDTLLLLVTFRLAYAIRAGWPGGNLPTLYPLEQYTIVAVFALPLSLLALWAGSVYRYRTPRTYLAEAWLVVRALFLAAVLVATLAFLLKWHFLSRSFLVLFFVLAASILVAFKGIARLVFRAIGRRTFAERNVLVVTGSGDVEEILRGIREHRNWGLHLLGVVPLSDDAAFVDAPRLGRFETIDAVLDASPVDEVVFAVSRDELPRIDAAVLTCEQMGIRARLAVSLVPTAIGKVRVEEFHGHPLLDLSSLPDHEIRFAIRRLFDVALAGISLLVASPLLAVAGVLIRLEDGGPVLFRQVRCGLNGRRFELLKLRTMVSGADSHKESLLPRNEMSGPVFKIRLDPRVTRVGAFLRRFSIDELPQLWNVLRGDMALVGPRPPVPEEVARYERWQRRRLSMKPGMTGLWQVSGRSEIDFDEWMKLDLRYIDNWSFWLDLKILLKTFPAVISGKGAQ